MHSLIGTMRVAGMAIRYSQFVPQLYRLCLSYGFTPGLIMPSRAFCSDENQGYPVMLIAQHFGTFPFDHGRVGGQVATDRHGPYAHHGEDLVIVHASHIGYDPATSRYGVYRRPRTAAGGFGPACGKLTALLSWYEAEYALARHNLRLMTVDGEAAIAIDNALADNERDEGLFLDFTRLIDQSRPAPLRTMATCSAFILAEDLRKKFATQGWAGGDEPLGPRLTADLFHFRRQQSIGAEGFDTQEAAFVKAMPRLVTSSNPMLDAARFNTQIEFDRTYRSIQREEAYKGKNVLFVSGLNVDVSPPENMLFPLTKFVPWAAYAQLRDGRTFVLEQAALYEALVAQPTDNPHQITFDTAIEAMTRWPAVELPEG